MKIIVGRTVKTVCSRSASALPSRARDWSRAMRVCSVSTGAPQFEQKRTLGVTYAPQTEQVIRFSLSRLGRIFARQCNTKRGGNQQRFRLAKLWTVRFLLTHQLQA